MDTVIDGGRELEWEGGGTEGVIGGLRKDLEEGERGREADESLVQQMANACTCMCIYPLSSPQTPDDQ